MVGWWSPRQETQIGSGHLRSGGSLTESVCWTGLPLSWVVHVSSSLSEGCTCMCVCVCVRARTLGEPDAVTQWRLEMYDFYSESMSTHCRGVQRFGNTQAHWVGSMFAWRAVGCWSVVTMTMPTRGLKSKRRGVLQQPHWHHFSDLLHAVLYG